MNKIYDAKILYLKIKETKICIIKDGVHIVLITVNQEIIGFQILTKIRI